MRKSVWAFALIIALAGVVKADGDKDKNKKDEDSSFEFKPDTLVLSRSVYQGTSATVTVGQTLPPGCVASTVNVPVLMVDQPPTTTPVTVSCAKATFDGTYPTVFNNDTPDGSFGVTSPIFIDNIRTDGTLIGTLTIPTNMIVTSFSSKSELALNRSLDRRSITFVGYVGGTGFVTGINQLDVSNSNTPGVIDPTNPVVSQYYRSVAEVDAHGHVAITDGNAYSGNNGRAAFKADSMYYLTGNNNNGGLKVLKSGFDQLDDTQIGLNLLGSNGAELLVPGQAPPVFPNIAKIGDFEINQVIDPGTCPPPPAAPGACTKYVLDKPGKDNNFRGLTIFHHTMYVTKGSGGNGINTVYQVGNTGILPTGDEATLHTLPITPLPGFPTTLASGMDGTAVVPVAYPFGIWFADEKTLYVCDEGDGTLLTTPVNGNVADTATLQTAGVQKWHFDGTSWHMLYVLQSALNIGVPYSVANYPSPATDGCRNIAGKNNHDGTVTIYAVTSTISTSGDQGADPNKLVKVTDKLSATTLPVRDGDHDRDDQFGVFTTIRTAASGEVLRGVAFAPQDRDDDDDDGYSWDR